MIDLLRGSNDIGGRLFVHEAIVERRRLIQIPIFEEILRRTVGNMRNKIMMIAMY
jgi:hypothetical protein